ncbi:hypothetical protein AX17_002829 [Amanita inopinata Kibby_2008]|nr:hypothetical protein AX17_002829 [Amanita inopinata Kibby_2008]
MERHRRRLMQERLHWGDPTPSHPCAKSGGAWPREILTQPPANHPSTSVLFSASSMNPRPTAQPSRDDRWKPILTNGWSLEQLISSGSNFRPVRRVSAHDKVALSAALAEHDKGGEPLIIGGWHKYPCWPHNEFNLDWFKLHGPQNIKVRNVLDWTDKDMSISAFIDKCRAAPRFASETDQERFYGKDVDCPELWQEKLNQLGIPTQLLPESSSDLLSNQPKEARVKTLMCYLGIGDTFTPCHKDLCSSSGQNLMCYTENGGSSFWFMTSTEDVFNATRYFHEIHRELDHETNIVTVEELSKAPFKIFITEQKLGDLVLVPPRSCHQVINHGGITIKTSWSRMTLDGLIAAYYHELPIYQRVCRFETYRVKYTIYCSLRKYTAKLCSLTDTETEGQRTRRRSRPGATPITSQKRILASELVRLLEAYEAILIDELPLPDAPVVQFPLVSSDTVSSTNLEDILGGDRITCDFCGADVFQSFFECRSCVASYSETVGIGYGCVICPACYVDGRCCQCRSMCPIQCRSMSSLLAVREEAVRALCKLNTKHSRRKLPDKLGVFAAACLRNQMYSPPSISMCTVDSGTHSARNHDSLSCWTCNKTACFGHLLQHCGIHAVDALLDHAAPDKKIYHERCHNLIQQDLVDADAEALSNSIKHGTPPNLKFQRYHMATFFRRCLPESQLVQYGYYDEGWIDSERRTPHLFDRNKSRPECPPSPTSSLLVPGAEPARKPTTPLSDTSSLTDLSSDEEMIIARRPPSNRNRNRTLQVLEYVDVPPLSNSDEYRPLRIASENASVRGLVYKCRALGEDVGSPGQDPTSDGQPESSELAKGQTENGESCCQNDVGRGDNTTVDMDGGQASEIVPATDEVSNPEQCYPTEAPVALVNLCPVLNGMEQDICEVHEQQEVGGNQTREDTPIPVIGGSQLTGGTSGTLPTLHSSQSRQGNRNAQASQISCVGESGSRTSSQAPMDERVEAGFHSTGLRTASSNGNLTLRRPREGREFLPNRDREIILPANNMSILSTAGIVENAGRPSKRARLDNEDLIVGAQDCVPPTAGGEAMESLNYPPSVHDVSETIPAPKTIQNSLSNAGKEPSRLLAQARAKIDKVRPDDSSQTGLDTASALTVQLIAASRANGIYHGPRRLAQQTNEVVRCNDEQLNQGRDYFGQTRQQPQYPSDAGEPRDRKIASLESHLSAIESRISAMESRDAKSLLDKSVIEQIAEAVAQQLKPNHLAIPTLSPQILLQAPIPMVMGRTDAGFSDISTPERHISGTTYGANRRMNQASGLDRSPSNYGRRAPSTDSRDWHSPHHNRRSDYRGRNYNSNNNNNNHNSWFGSRQPRKPWRQQWNNNDRYYREEWISNNGELNNSNRYRGWPNNNDGRPLRDFTAEPRRSENGRQYGRWMSPVAAATENPPSNGLHSVASSSRNRLPPQIRPLESHRVVEQEINTEKQSHHNQKTHRDLDPDWELYYVQDDGDGGMSDKQDSSSPSGAISESPLILDDALANPWASMPSVGRSV